MKVLKFGGSSVRDADRISQVATIIKSSFDGKEPLIVVVSAIGGVTDLLLDMCDLAVTADLAYKEKLELFKKRHLEIVHNLFNAENFIEILKDFEEGFEALKDLLHGIELVQEASLRTKDHVLSFGERNSAYILAHYLRQTGINAFYNDARKLIATDNQFGNARVDFEKTNSRISSYFKDKKDSVHIVTGFIGSNENGLTTTLGRGGSDFTASILGAAIDAAHVEIWTDVDGVLTSDPRKVKNAFTVDSLSYAEAMELSHFGAKVIYPPTIQPLLSRNIPFYIKNTFNPEFKGTFVSSKSNGSQLNIKGVSSISDIVLINIQGSGLVGVPGIASRLFGALARNGVNIIMITQGSSEHSISFAILPNQAKHAKMAVEEEFKYELQAKLIEEIKPEYNLTTVAIVGENMKNVPGISGQLFQALGKNGINVVAIAQGSSELNISLVISKDDEVKALNVIHDGFFLSDSKSVHLFMVGVGLIGGTLIDQIKEHKAHLSERLGLELKLVGLANTKKMIFNENGIDLDNWEGDLNASSLGSNMEAYVRQMIDLNLRNSVFIDNTASKDVPLLYESILHESISISTPNKVATSSSLEQYNKLKELARKRNVSFLYETNVGAGLPLITTINQLILSGDKVLGLEAILSGSISFIFNNFVPGTRFSQLVTKAKEEGYTEPDPREDLSGMDVRRKITILGRECGYDIEPDDVEIEGILPESCLAANSVEDFFTALEKEDGHFESLLKESDTKGEKLRFIASLNNGKAVIKLISVGAEHPFYNLAGSDNMVIIHSERYATRPLIVQGPGAGAQVTAAGVFAEIINIASKY